MVSLTEKMSAYDQLQTVIYVINSILNEQWQTSTGSYTHGLSEGGKGGTIPRAPNHYGGAKNTFFNAVHLLPKNLRFEHGAQLVSYPGRHLISLRPWLYFRENALSIRT